MTRDIQRALHDIADSASALSSIAEGGANQRPSALLAGRIRRRRAVKAAGLAIVGVGTATGIAFAGLPGAVLSTTTADNAGIILAQTSSSGTSSASGTSTASATGTPTAKGDHDADPKTWPTPPPECQSFFDAWKVWWAAKEADRKTLPTAWPTSKPTAWPTSWPTDKSTFTIDPKVKAWIDNMPAACKTFFPFGKFNDPKADQTMPKAPEVKPSWSPTAPAPMMPAFGNKWPTTSMPTAPAGTGGSSTRTQWQGGTFPSSPGWGH
jgi:hypothetical protein